MGWALKDEWRVFANIGRIPVPGTVATESQADPVALPPEHVFRTCGSGRGEEIKAGGQGDSPEGEMLRACRKGNSLCKGPQVGRRLAS